MAELPQCTIRESARAKRVIIKASLRDGLVVVVPRGFDQRQVPRILAEKREWIHRTFARIEEKRRALAENADGVLPRKLNLRATDEKWLMDYERGEPARVALTMEGDKRLLISGDIDDRALVRSVLRRFLINKGNIDLVRMLRSLADEHGFAMNRASVRLQKTRWGSCSAKGAISLNAKLLFLPRDVVEYVMIHELCHTMHHNHSPEFWKLVQKHLPRALVLRQELRDDAWRFVPPWLDGVRI